MSFVHYYYDPVTDFDRLFDNAFTSRFQRSVTAPSTTTTETGRDLFRPTMDVHESTENNTVTATFDLPGIKPEEVNIDVHQNRLTVSGETSSTQERDEAGYTVRERSCGRFSRTLVLPQGTKPDDVKAKMEHGLLNVTFPKGQPQQPPKRITIE